MPTLLQIVAPPMIVAPSVAPAIVEPSGERYRIPRAYTAPQKPITVEVDATARGQTIWHGTLRLGRSTGAAFDQSLTQAAPAGCGDTDEDRRATSRDSLRITLNAYWPATANRTNFDVKWDRPTENCTPSGLQRSVAVSGTVELEPNKPVTIEGDGDLRVRFTLR